jgi:hypothetical protein
MKKTDFKNIQKGEFLSCTEYYKVISKDANSIKVENQLGEELTITGPSYIESFQSAGQYHTTVKAAKHEMISHLHDAKDKVFTVCFEKADKSERILVGHLVSIEAHLGRTKVIDIEIPLGENNLRLIDNRTISWIVLDGIKYIAQ